MTMTDSRQELEALAGETNPRAAIIKMLWEKQFEGSPWHDKFHLIRPDSLEADYGTFADKLIGAVNSLRLAATQPDAGAVKVKPLEWTIEKRYGINIHIGRGAGFMYEAAIKVYSAGWVVTMGGDTFYNSDDADEDAAKAAAQADYEQRIRSALVHPAPASDVALRGALGMIADRLCDLNQANAQLGSDPRLSSPDWIARNDREKSWLRDLRSTLVLSRDPGEAKSSDGLCPVPSAIAATETASDEGESIGTADDGAAHRMSDLNGSLAHGRSTQCENSVSPGPSEAMCERCQGNGEIVTDWSRYTNPHIGDTGEEALAECPDCDGTGRVDTPHPAPEAATNSDGLAQPSAPRGEGATEQERSPSSSEATQPEPRRWRHRKRGTDYTEVGRGNLQAPTDGLNDGCEIVIYRGKNGHLWARATFEFEDGRFEALPPQPEPEAVTVDEVARIIDPEGFADLARDQEWCRKYGKDEKQWCYGLIKRTDAALTKATAILASGLVTADEASIRVDEREKIECLRLIDELRADEGNSVSILCPNPDFNGQPDHAVEVSAFWHDNLDSWQTRRFSGDTLLDCLRKARAAIRAGGAK